MTIETKKEEDGRWLAEVPDLPGVLVYSTTQSTAIAKAKAMALRVIADRLEHGEEVPELKSLFLTPA
jgi:predicted RNase H-like HicB family nuclease